MIDLETADKRIKVLQSRVSRLECIEAERASAAKDKEWNSFKARWHRLWTYSYVDEENWWRRFKQFLRGRL